MKDELSGYCAPDAFKTVAFSTEPDIRHLLSHRLLAMNSNKERIDPGGPALLGRFLMCSTRIEARQEFPQTSGMNFE